ncbi:MAG TPA: hypothetical protein VF698_13360 [Thermoanaerobaculia bacterium]
MVARQAAPVDRGVDLDLLVAEDKLDALARPGAGDRVAAPLEAEKPVARDGPSRALDDQIRRRRQRQQRGAVALSTDRHDLAVRAMHARPGDVVVSRAPSGVGLLVA